MPYSELSTDRGLAASTPAAERVSEFLHAVYGWMCAGLAITAAAFGEQLAPVASRAETCQGTAANQPQEVPKDVTRKLARFIVSSRCSATTN